MNAQYPVRVLVTWPAELLLKSSGRMSPKVTHRKCKHAVPYLHFTAKVSIKNSLLKEAGQSVNTYLRRVGDSTPLRQIMGPANLGDDLIDRFIYASVQCVIEIRLFGIV